MTTIFSDGIVVIRPFERSDVSNLFTAVSESQQHIAAFLSWYHPNYSIRDSKAWVSLAIKNWRKHHEFQFVICDVQTGEICGAIGISQIEIENKVADLGYWVRRGYLRKGIATRALRLAIAFAFQELDLVRLELLIREENIASQRVVEKIKATKEGLLKNRLFNQGESHDAWMYAVLRHLKE